MHAVNRFARQRPLAGLAFVAALLLALAPSLSRVLHYAASDPAGMAMLCTHDGLQQVALHAHHDAAPPAHHDEDGDCAYCPLLAHGTLPAAVAAFVALPLPLAPAPVSRPPLAPRAAFILAAQARGPPRRFA